jgi:hypothetical protein
VNVDAGLAVAVLLIARPMNIGVGSAFTLDDGVGVLSVA